MKVFTTYPHQTSVLLMRRRLQTQYDIQFGHGRNGAEGLFAQ